MTTRLCILGATGSIGASVLNVVSRNPQFSVDSLVAGKRWKILLEQVKLHTPRVAILQDEQAAELLAAEVKNLGLGTRVESGPTAMLEAAAAASADTVVAAIVGAAGLETTLAAIRAGKRLLLANKEALVMCGDLMQQEARQSGSAILPLDSEHNAIFQSLPFAVQCGEAACKEAGVASLVLTASGGPFRGMKRKQLEKVSLQQALTHPNWDMGPKITIDSATLMNKGLEVIEASYLFNLPPAEIEVVVHPQSVVHSMVRYLDGSVLAQLGRPDMRTPIAHALAWPERIQSGVEALDFLAMGELTFEPPDTETFPCLDLAFQVLKQAGTAPAVLNAANEVAVDHYLNQSVSFLQLPRIIEDTLSRSDLQSADDLETIMQADKHAREIAHRIVSGA